MILQEVCVLTVSFARRYRGYSANCQCRTFAPELWSFCCINLAQYIKIYLTAAYMAPRYRISCTCRYHYKPPNSLSDNASMVPETMIRQMVYVTVKRVCSAIHAVRETWPKLVCMRLREIRYTEWWMKKCTYKYNFTCMFICTSCAIKIYW